MPSECPSCHEVSVDTEPGGELVCHECGAVVESRVFSCEADSSGGFTFMNDDGTARFDGRYELSKGIRQRLPTSDTSVAGKLLQKCLYLQGRRMNLSKEILSQARQLLLNTVAPKVNSGEIRRVCRQRNVLTACCLFIVCRQNNVQLTYKRMAEVAECNMFILGRAVKIILQVLDIKLEPAGVESIVPSVLSHLSVADKSCEKLCLDLWHIFKHYDLIGVRNHPAAATCLVLLVLECKNITPSKEKIAEVLGKHSVTKVQVGTQSKNARKGLVDLAKQVPWIPKSVKPMGISRHIIEIVNFHKNCVKLDSSTVKSGGMKQREIIENNRKTKIQKAKARLLHKEQRQQERTSSESSEADSDHSPPNAVSSHQSKDEVVVIQPGTTSSVKTAGPSTNSSDVSAGIHNSSCTEGPLDDLAKYNDLDDNDILIESLLKNGYSEEELMDGYFESRMCNLQSSQCDPEGDREDLDEQDIAEREMHHYLWSVAEMERIKSLKDANPLDELDEASQQQQG